MQRTARTNLSRFQDQSSSQQRWYTKCPRLPHEGRLPRSTKGTSCRPRHQAYKDPSPLQERAGGRLLAIIGISGPSLSSINPVLEGISRVQTTHHSYPCNRSRFRDQSGGLSSWILPQPEDDFELLVPDDEGEDESESGQVLSEEDAAERDARIKCQKE